MSRRSSRFIPHVPPVPMSAPRAYYLQDDADFSEGEMDPPFAWTETGGPSPPSQGMHENMGNQADVTELYRRKPEEHYLFSQEVIMPEELPRYYYRPATMARLPQRRLPVAMTPSSHATGGPSQMQHPGGYFPPPMEESRVQYDGIVYRSSPHLHRMPPERTMSPNARIMRRPHQAMPENNPAASSMVRTVRPVSKAPVSVPTPRFYRRSSNIYKRPSTLCLQLPSTPDPATRLPKTRLPCTIPGISLPPMGLRPVHVPHFPTHHPATINRGPQIIERPRESEDPTPRKNLTARSAPPRCPEERLNNDEEIERMQRMIYEQRGVNEYGDESGSNQGEAEPKCSELELLLNHYEQTFRNNLEQSSGVPKQNSRRSSTKSRAKRKVSVSRFTGLMKPRLPPSLKGLQKRASSKQALTSSADEDRIEIEQMTADVLDNLLQDLSVGGLAEDAQPPRLSPEVKKTDSKNVSRTGSKPGSREISRGVSRVESRICSRPSSRAMSARLKNEKSTRDISEKKSNNNLSPKKSESFQFVEIKNPTSFEEDMPTNTTFMQDKEKFSKYVNSSNTSFEPEKLFSDRRSREPTPFGTEETKDNLEAFKKEVSESSGSKDNVKKAQLTKKPKSEDHTALELHRSKSYIVNLIDRALSRELGTIPEEKSSKQYLNLDARTAMDLISSKNLDTEMCVEITQAIADSFNSVGKDKGSPSPNLLPAGSSKHPDSARSDSKESELVFTTGNEEPLYIKQLKKLRWGHLKHIQREMRRLEDLERFLDSCGSDK